MMTDERQQMYDQLCRDEVGTLTAASWLHREWAEIDRLRAEVAAKGAEIARLREAIDDHRTECPLAIEYPEARL